MTSMGRRLPRLSPSRWTQEYEIDLNEEHAAKLREALAPYVAAARRAGGSSTPRRQSAAPKRSRRTWPRFGHGWPGTATR